jgi:hypothetical protein
MSTVAPPSKPISPALVDSEHYIDDHIRRTRRALKLADLSSGLITLLIGLLTFLLAAAVLDQWVFSGGLSEGGRRVLFGALVLGVAWYGWRRFAPLLRRINPVFAAQAIERGAPSLKNSLLNVLLFRSHRRDVSARVYHALEQQAAQRLSSTTLDATVDRSALLKLGYLLLLVVALCAAYSVLSPKNLALSAGRVLAPWADLAAPTRVQILHIEPGAASVARGERVAVSAQIHGLRAEEPVRLHYSTADEQLVDESIEMTAPAGPPHRFEARLPRGADGAPEAGVMQHMVYWIEAGDARSRKFKLTVFDRPTIIVQQVKYDYPAYTGFPSKEVASTGDVAGLEGTRVTLAALANQPIKSAYVDFDADGRNDLQMNVDGDRATATFELGLRDDRRTPLHGSYVLRFTSRDGRTNSDPPKYRIDVTPDYAPEVRITKPEEPETTARVDEIVKIGVEARDPDFALSRVWLEGQVGERQIVLAELLSKNRDGRLVAGQLFTPADAHLRPGDVLEFWARAEDNRRPEPNVGLSERRRLKITGPAEKPGKPQQQPGGQQQQGDPQQGENPQAGNQGAGGQQPQGGEAGANDQGGEGESQQGPGGTAGGEGQPNGKNQQQGGGEGSSNADSADASGQQQSSDAAGGASAGNADQQQQQSEGASGGGQPGESSQQPSDKASPGQAGGADGQTTPGQQQPGQQQQGQPGEGQSQPGEQQGQPQDGQQSKVSSQGDDDGTAFRRLADQLGAKPEGESPQDASQKQQPQAGQQQGAGDAQQGAGEQAGNSEQGQPQEKPAAQPNGKAGEQSGAHQSGDAEKNAKGQQAGQSGEPREGEPRGNQPSDAAGASREGSQQQQQQKPGQPQTGPRENAAGDAQTSPGERPEGRQGDDVPREAKTGDGNPQQQQDGDNASPDSAMNRNDGDAGSGHNTGQEQGSPGDESSAKKAVDKSDVDNQKAMDDQAPPGGSPDKKESDSRGGQSGEQTGGGQEGAGQHADASGKGESGQHQAADQGAGRADQQGAGETGEKAGDSQTADGKTGQSSGDKPGAGSRQQAGGERAAPGGEQNQGQQPDGSSSAEQAAGQQPPDGKSPDGKQGEKQPGDAASQAKPPGGEQGAQPSAGDQGQAQGDQPQGGQQPGGQSPTDGQPPAGDDQGQEQQPGSQTAGNSPSQGGGAAGGNANSSSAKTPEADRADAANLEYARKQTALVLERLDEQLAKKQVDPKLLNSLGWSEAELRQFAERWKGLKVRAAGNGEQADAAKRELDSALRSLGLRRGGPLRYRAAGAADELRDLREGYRTRAPVEYADQVRRYTKGVSGGDQ